MLASNLSAKKMGGNEKMSKLANAKTFGGIGALLSLIGGFIPAVGPVLALIGLILVFVAVKYISDVTKDQPIFKHYLMSFILTVIALIAIVALGFVAVGGFSLFAAFQDMNVTDPTAVWGTLGASIGICIAGLIIRLDINRYRRTLPQKKL